MKGEGEGKRVKGGFGCGGYKDRRYWTGASDGKRAMWQRRGVDRMKVGGSDDGSISARRAREKGDSGRLRVGRG